MHSWVFAVLIVVCLTLFITAEDEEPPSQDGSSLDELYNKFIDQLSKEGKKNKTRKADGFRKAEFIKSSRKVASQKKLFATGKSKYNLEVNKFADMTPEEKQKYLGIPPTKLVSSKSPPSVKSIRTENVRFKVPPTFPIVNKTTTFNLPKANGFKVVKGASGVAASIDYRDTGFVSNVKNQDSCGSCWSFSTTGVLEGQMPQLRSLAEQQLVDCAAIDVPYGGCDGAWPQHALEWMRDNTKQLGLQTSYPYLATKKTCYTSNTAGVVVSKVETVPKNDENALMAAVANKGPVSITLNADELYLYKEGIFDSPTCSKAVNHAVLAVGYGSENGADYWIIKNSWGEDWGEYGFMRMARGSNMCGIVSEDSTYASIEQDVTSKLECVDQSPYCMTWAKSGYCDVNPTYMKEKCKAACLKCSSPRVYIRSCIDKNPQCAAWATAGDCINYWQYMLYNCPKACKICTQWIGYYLYPDWLLKAATA